MVFITNAAIHDKYVFNTDADVSIPSILTIVDASISPLNGQISSKTIPLLTA